MKRRSRSRKGKPFLQRVIVVMAFCLVSYSLLRPGPQVTSVAHWVAQDLTATIGDTGGKSVDQAPTQEMATPAAPGEYVESQFGANDTRVRPEGAPLSPVPRYGCPAISAKRKLDVSGNVSTVEMLKVQRSTYITKFSEDIHYAHMAMIEKIRMPDGKLRFVSAWQAAPRAPVVTNPNNGDRFQRVAVEGLPKQRIYWAMSDDEGVSWSEAQEVPPDQDALWSAYWSPVLFFDEKKQILWLFYAVSNSCQKVVQNTTLWEPGGDIRAKQMSVVGSALDHLTHGGPRKSWTWGKGRTLLKEKTDGIPKVIANKPTVLLNGDWVMPFWREQPPRENNSTCTPKDEKAIKSRFMYAHIANRTSSGVLISTDQGATWNPYGDIRERRTNLIEGSLVEVVYQGKPELHCYFRAIVGCVFRSISFDNGRSWTRPEPLPISNPNTKFSVVQVHPPKGTNTTLENSLLVMAFNNHKRGQPGCTSCRTHLHLAASVDYGNTWTQIALLEDEFVEGVRIHYPTMLQTGDDLHVIYSRFYLGKYNLDQCKVNKGPCLGLYSKNQGIKLVTLDISSLYSIPQLYTKDKYRPEMTNTVEKILMALIDLRLSEVDSLGDHTDAKLKKIYHFRSSKWDKVVNMIMNRFDVNNLGGIHMVRKQSQMHKFFQQVLDDRLQSRYGSGMLKPRPDQKCTCKVNHPFSGITYACPCVCRDDENCVILCYLGIANCGTLHVQRDPNRVARNAESMSKKMFLDAKKRPKGKHL
ncbi:sialidase [Chloropicon primus]|uniref:Sialidase n=2 Tax=Chloropicon primus TaxID=1764295 RepID=A0A5B8MIB7_9CHLO|nr:sialidase [Chloropicon primus]UPQ98614.1 sialidase [Chloropicon primus]|eukprot:QDZ19405.1 sialidase [Chloropicon primus]